MKVNRDGSKEEQVQNIGVDLILERPASVRSFLITTARSSTKALYLQDLSLY